MKKILTFNSVIFTVIGLFSLTGLVASFLLTLETIQIYKTPEASLICNINSVINCASIMKSPEAEVFGFPNTLLGLIGYSVMGTIAAYYLFTQKINKLFALFALLGATIAFAFSNWLIYHSVYVTKALCPFCLVSYTSATNIFISFILYNLRENSFKLPENISKKIQAFIAKRWYAPLIAVFYIIIIALIIMQFKDRWS